MNYYRYVGIRAHLISGLKRKKTRELIIYFNFTIKKGVSDVWAQLTNLDVLTEIYGKRKPYFVAESSDLQKWIRRRHALL